MILKRKDTHGKIRYGVRVYKDHENKWLGTFDTLREARESERNALSAKEVTQGVSCGDFARQWLLQDCPRTSGRQLKSETVKEYHYRLRAFIKEFSAEPLCGLRRDVAFRWALEHKHDVPFVAALFAHAHDLGLLESSPFASLGLSKGKGRKHNVPLTETQLHELADASYGVKGTEWKPYAAQFRAFILFQAYSTLRPGETFELKWSDIDGSRIHVRRRRGKYGTVDLPKSNTEREVLLPPPAKEALATFPRSLDYVFRGIRGQALRRGSAFRYFEKVRDAYGRPDLTLYHLRHWGAWYLYTQIPNAQGGRGLEARIVAEQLGHDDGGALVQRLYGHGNVGALDVLDEAWKAAITA